MKFGSDIPPRPPRDELYRLSIQRSHQINIICPLRGFMTTFLLMTFSTASVVLFIQFFVQSSLTVDSCLNTHSPLRIYCLSVIVNNFRILLDFAVPAFQM